MAYSARLRSEASPSRRNVRRRPSSSHGSFCMGGMARLMRWRRRCGRWGLREDRNTTSSGTRRRALGEDADGNALLIRAGDLRLSPLVTSDWAHFLELATCDDHDVRVAALSLVRGKPFGDVDWPWSTVEGLAATMEAEVCDLASSIGEQALLDGDASLAAHAAEQGILASPYDERLYRLLMRARPTPWATPPASVRPWEGLRPFSRTTSNRSNLCTPRRERSTKRSCAVGVPIRQPTRWRPGAQAVRARGQPVAFANRRTPNPASRPTSTTTGAASNTAPRQAVAGAGVALA